MCKLMELVAYAVIKGSEKLNEYNILNNIH